MTVEDIIKLIGAFGGYIVAVGIVVMNNRNARRAKQREIDATPYELITEWLRRVDAMAFDLYQKASEDDNAWKNATYDWEKAKSEFNWVMGLVKSLDNPSPLYEYVEKHYKSLLDYEQLAQNRHKSRSESSIVQDFEKKHEELQAQLHTSSGAIYKELRIRRKQL